MFGHIYVTSNKSRPRVPRHLFAILSFSIFLSLMPEYDAQGCWNVPNNGAKASRNNFVAWQFSTHSVIWKPQDAQMTKISDEKWSYQTIDSLNEIFLYSIS